MSEVTEKNNVMMKANIKHVNNTMIRKEYYGDDDDIYHSSHSNEEDKYTSSRLSRKRSRVSKKSMQRNGSNPSYPDNDYSSY
mmetsp:Transcript_39024/g.59426  ORF Transcript_39024/g.59426 Transcript_39024/m.59426 type:complete len:82 (+) Transcript_39024:2223-2468(+)|eukprot:CAMPEP_0170485404 /NCGR_PEP_ID=MMETSP0208-20121228/4688_1 /TAXON_ID=197538 /ORGANISM="Strombidium inclinatum, Strain S3" /LENGTH=81 /DNA_ID=CAMNT_0010759049 /DNA_START=2195 /DNA_END=2440 /DNA_ORIENTATION=-